MEKEVEEDHMDEAGQRGQILWIRGLSRLQHQVSGYHANPYVFDVILSVDWISLFIVENFYLAT
jgi:Plasma membrane calcium transporter ATPase C terminal